jgi:hypothetical protein
MQVAVTNSKVPNRQRDLALTPFALAGSFFFIDPNSERSTNTKTVFCGAL